jgi:hypothetical protein
MAHAVDELLLLNRFILSELTVRDLWDDGVFAGLHVVPVLGKLLSIRYEAVDLNPALARQEACRIGAILYLAGVRHRFGVNLAKDIYIPKLKEFIIAQDGLISENVDPILLWVLVIGGMQSFMHEEHKWYVSATANLIVRKQLNMWEELMAIMYEVLWIGGILEAECNEFQGEVNEELWTTYRQIFS